MKNDKPLLIPSLKPRNSTHQVLADKRNAAGKHRDKKRELKNGELKYKDKVEESVEKSPFGVAQDMLGCSKIKKMDSISQSTLDSAKRISMERFDSAAGEWVIQHFRNGKQDFVQVQSPTKDLTYVFPALDESWMNHRNGKFTADMSDCGADLEIFNEEKTVKTTFKMFLEAEEKSKKPPKKTYQVRVSTTHTTGDWEDVDLHSDSLDDIEKAVSASPVDDKAHEKFGLHELTTCVEKFIGDGPAGHGSTWDEMDFDVRSHAHDVLKISFTFSGVDMRGTRKKHNPDRYGEPVRKSGVITIMPAAQ